LTEEQPPTRTERFWHSFKEQTLLMFLVGWLSVMGLLISKAETYLVINASLGAVGLSLLWGGFVGLVEAYFPTPSRKSDPPH
jgi:hypothetical protein